MSDPTRAALEAAAMTIDPDPDMPPPHVVRDITGAPLTMAAAAIAAFLRALPDGMLVRDPEYPCSYPLFPVIRHGLAAAVEAAAKEGGA